MTTKQEISEWFDRGVNLGKTHMIVCCDTFDHEDFPIFVGAGESPSGVIKEYSRKEMMQVMEAYDLQADKEAQLNAHRAWCIDS